MVGEDRLTCGETMARASIPFNPRISRPVHRVAGRA